MSRPWLRIAHRGASGTAPELTRAAIARALEIGVDMIEVDIQLTADGEMVVLHDHELDRTTTGKGPVREKSWAEIRHLDAGSWFDPRFAAERLLRLDDLLDLVGDSIELNLEIKAPAEDWPALVPKMLAALEARGRIERTIFSCFELEALEVVRRHSDRARLGILWYMPDLTEAWAVAERLGAVSLHPWEGIAQRPLFEEARRRRLLTYVWTVNDIDAMRRLIDAGADGVMSDHPERFAEVEKTG